MLSIVRYFENIIDKINDGWQSEESEVEVLTCRAYAENSFLLIKMTCPATSYHIGFLFSCLAHRPPLSLGS